MISDLEKDYAKLRGEGLEFLKNCDLLAHARLEVEGPFRSPEKTAACNLQVQALRAERYKLFAKIGRLYIRSTTLYEVDAVIKQRILYTTLDLLDGAQAMDRRISEIAGEGKWYPLSAPDSLESLFSVLIEHTESTFSNPYTRGEVL